MKFIKRGLVYCPDNDFWWAKTHSHVPTVDILEDRLRIYFAGFDENLTGRIGYVDVQKDNPSNIIDISEEPVLDIGDMRMFDHYGVAPCSIINKDGYKWLYYFGWQKYLDESHSLFCGLAVSKDGKHFERYSKTPILDRILSEPYLRSAMFVMKKDNIYVGWYASAWKWEKINDKYEPYYSIYHTVSQNGINWSPGIKCLELKNNEFGVTRPYVWEEDNKLKMLYSKRSTDNTKAYSIGYAEYDNFRWERKDYMVDLKASENENDWDYMSVSYPYLVNVDNKKYMFYNGYRFGATGFGHCEVI